jgi:hypothetical protein
MKKSTFDILVILIILSTLLTACGGNPKGPSDRDLAAVLTPLNNPSLSDPKITGGFQCEVPEDKMANGVSEIWYLSYIASGVSDGRIFLQKLNGDWVILKDFYECTQIK